MLSGALTAQAVVAPTPAAPAVLPKILVKKGIGPDIVLEKDKEEKTAKMNKWKKISQLRRVLCPIKWQEKFDGMYLVYTHKKRTDFLKQIKKHHDILTKNENKETVIYGDLILNSNFKSLFKSMVSNQNNLTKSALKNFSAY